MKVQCKNCLPKEGIEIPFSTPTEKRKLGELKLKSPLEAVKFLMEVKEINHRDSKYIVTHVNTKYGKCNRCKFNKLEGEYLTCPKCGALNFNWIL